MNTLTDGILCPLFRKILVVSAATCLLIPQLALADPLYLFRTPDTVTHPVPSPERQNLGDGFFAVRNNGDLEIRCNGFTTVMAAYEPSIELRDSPDRLRLAQRQEAPLSKGISVQLNFTF